MKFSWNINKKTTIFYNLRKWLNTRKIEIFSIVHCLCVLYILCQWLFSLLLLLSVRSVTVFALSEAARKANWLNLVLLNCHDITTFRRTHMTAKKEQNEKLAVARKFKAHYFRIVRIWTKLLGISRKLQEKKQLLIFCLFLHAPKIVFCITFGFCCFKAFLQK